MPNSSSLVPLEVITSEAYQWGPLTGAIIYDCPTARGAWCRNISCEFTMNSSPIPSQWYHECHDVWNHQQFNCLYNRLFKQASKKTSKLVTGGFPSQRVSNVEIISMSWCHHADKVIKAKYFFYIFYGIHFANASIIVSVKHVHLYLVSVQWGTHTVKSLI